MKTGMGSAIRISLLEPESRTNSLGPDGRCGSSSRAQTASADESFEEYEVPGNNPMLSGLAVASDGVVWFAMLHSGSLGRLQTAGSIFSGCHEMAHDRAALQSIPQAISGTRTSAACGMLPVREAVANSGNRATQMRLSDTTRPSSRTSCRRRTLVIRRPSSNIPVGLARHPSGISRF